VLSPRAVLDGIDWGGLEHAYGSASDAPARLVMLLSEDAEQCGEVLAYLDSAILHQGTMYSATAPAALFVAAVLDDPRTLISCQSALPWDDREQSVRAALLEWLGLVAESAVSGESAGGTADGGEVREAARRAGRYGPTCVHVPSDSWRMPAPPCCYAIHYEHRASLPMDMGHLMGLAEIPATTFTMTRCCSS
jgi:hypothetical protein